MKECRFSLRNAALRVKMFWSRWMGFRRGVVEWGRSGGRAVTPVADEYADVDDADEPDDGDGDEGEGGLDAEI